MSSTTYDYIIAGGGLSGCVLASRLAQALPSHKILLLETGPDSRNNDAIASPGNAWMITPDYYHNYETLPQKHLEGRRVALKTGRALGGGSAVNYGGWTRGDRSGYDEWADVVGDERWGYEALLPYFKRAETYPLPGLEAQHGYDGPIKPSRGDRGYLLKEDVREAMLSTGVEVNEDANGGDIRGVARLVESWNRRRRTFAAGDYDLSKGEVLTGRTVARVVLEGGVARGVVLGDGKRLEARTEVIISCGALRTPQVLMLSGIGPRSQLEKFGIEVIVDSPQVGENLHDHGMVSFWYKLRHPEQGLAIGSEKFIPFEAPPMDGSHITVSVIGIHATSRGSVSLASTDPDELPLIDPAYLATEHDRAVIRTGAKIVAQMMESPAGQRISVGETPPGPFAPLTSKTSAREIDERARACMATTYHLAGSVAMGQVVDAECRVKGVKGLRVVDASIMPVSIGAHLQGSLYGIAERAAQMIIDAAENA
ncbi:GMC oxidoreductase [Zasmidium cellare ATCC 36951]|uniref:GMC oxidoreductase n=1 Tax=Zasmidium cellare ATCC 36951 TaxID=1080233 RepID=A0A6A6D6Z4_ZASCE|nr:GMC oxidoreductase [Zasmidium cellare ATCC 36951]KAF2173396.1 GMC oxidoreductase [Zasmidium cellare ATCC 36951]